MDSASLSRDQASECLVLHSPLPPGTHSQNRWQPPAKLYLLQVSKLFSGLDKQFQWGRLGWRSADRSPEKTRSGWRRQFPFAAPASARQRRAVTRSLVRRGFGYRELNARSPYLTGETLGQ